MSLKHVGRRRKQETSNPRRIHAVVSAKLSGSTPESHVISTPPDYLTLNLCRCALSFLFHIITCSGAAGLPDHLERYRLPSVLVRTRLVFHLIGSKSSTLSSRQESDMQWTDHAQSTVKHTRPARLSPSSNLVPFRSYLKSRFP